ncbi:MAG: hypothetical protein ACP5H1_04955, partial [Acidilobus sp.]
MLSTLSYAITQSLPSIIEFIIIVVIGVVVAYAVAAVLRRVLNLRFFAQYPDVANLLGLSVGAVKAFIILVSLAIGFSVLKLGMATVYMTKGTTSLAPSRGGVRPFKPWKSWLLGVGMPREGLCCACVSPRPCCIPPSPRGLGAGGNPRRGIGVTG